MPAAEEENGGDAGDRDDVAVLGHEERRKTHARVLGVKAGNELGFGFGQVEGDAIGFGECGSQENDEAEDLWDRRSEDAPLGDQAEVESCLAVDHFAEAQRVEHQQRSHDGKSHGEFVADHLRRTAKAAQQRILAGGGPTAQRDGVDADGRKRQDEQDADVDVGQAHLGLDAEDLDLRAEGDDRYGGERKATAKTGAIR